MNLDNMLSQSCPWLAANGEEGDVVIASRIRLARNLAGFPFASRATENDRRSIRDTLRHTAENILSENEYDFINVHELAPLDKAFLAERQIISQTLADFDGTCAAVVDRQERFSILINEEDHLRMHALQQGFAPQNIWQFISQLDDQFGSKLDYVFHKQYGFLTSYPTNAGTGLRVSVLLHLPALVLSKEIDKVIRSLQKVHLTVQGFCGTNPQQVLGDLFLIGNHIALGRSEEELIGNMTDLVRQVIGYERQARDFLLQHQRDNLRDRCCRTRDVLEAAQSIRLEEAMSHLSCLRLGINTGLVAGLVHGGESAAVNSLFLSILPAHLQKRYGSRSAPLSDDLPIDTLRSEEIRQKIGNVGMGQPTG